jgi:NUMOD4 motif/HNH endonuclease
VTVAWLPVTGYEGMYEVSSSGQVRSLPRKNRLAERILKPTYGHRYGYAMVALCRDGKVVRRTVHSLVAEAFIGPCPPGQEVRHGPVRLDNHAGNLSYGTHAENMADMVRDGTARKPSGRPWKQKPYVKKGYNPASRKLTEADVIDIRKRRAAGGITKKALALEYGVHESCIDHVIARRTFKNVA